MDNDTFSFFLGHTLAYELEGVSGLLQNEHEVLLHF